MRGTKLKSAAALIASAVAVASTPAVAGAAETVYGLTSSDGLVTFASDSPGAVSVAMPISGLPLLSDVVGIDVRPATGQLYALVKGTAPTANGAVYRIDPTNGAATLITSVPLDLSGTNFGFDFNPAADRIRIVSEETRQNLRVNPNTGNLAFTDGDLHYAPGDPGASGLLPSVSGVAYTNNAPAAASTALLAIDRANGVLAIQNPPNDGTLTTSATLGTSALAPSTGMDVSSSGLALAVGTPVSSPRRLYRVNTASAPALTDLGAFGVATNVDDIAIAQAPALLAAVTAEPAGAQRVFLFPSDRPAAVGALTPITGLAADERIVGIDSRPATGKIVALTDRNRLYTLDAVTGVASDGHSLTGNNANLSAGTTFGVDVNPVNDRLKVTLDNARSVSIVPDAPSLVTPDADVNYLPTDPGNGTNPRVVANGYTNAVPGATSTTLYAIDAARKYLVTQDTPTGTLTSVGPSGLFGDATTITDNAALDIVPGLNLQLAALQRTPNTYSELYALNGASDGRAVLSGRIGTAATPVVGSMTALLPAPAPGGGPGPPGAGSTPIPGAGTSGIPGIDKVAPIALVVANTLQAKTLLKNGLSVLMFCNERCTSSTRLLIGKDVIGAGTGSLSKAGDTRFRFKVSKAGRAKLRTNRNQRLALESTVVDGAGNRKSTRTALTALKTLPPPPKASARSSSLTKAQSAAAAPIALVVANGLQATGLRLNGLSVLFACDRACNVKSQLLAGDTLVGSGTGSINEAGISRFRFKLNPNGRRIISIDRSRRLGLESTVSDAAGNAKKQRTAVTVRRIVR